MRSNLAKRKFLALWAKDYPFALCSLLFALLAGCALGPKYLIPNYSAPRTVAVLPFANETNDVEGPETVRKLLIEMLPARGYYPIKKEEVDKILLEKFGISDGGQLGSVSAQELGKKLQVDGLFYGNLIKFIDVPLGFSRRRTVKANVKLVDSKTGNPLWEDEKSWSTELHLDLKEARNAAIRQVAERQLEKMTGTFLQEESRVMIELMLRNLPLAQ